MVLDELDKLARITERLVTLARMDERHPPTRNQVDAELNRIVRRWQATAEREWVVRSDIGHALINPHL